MIGLPRGGVNVGQDDNVGLVLSYAGNEHYLATVALIAKT